MGLPLETRLGTEREFRPRAIRVLVGELHFNNSGKYLSPVHNLIYTLWSDQRDRQQIPEGSMKIEEYEGSRGEQIRLVAVDVQTKDEEKQIFKLTRNFRDGVMAWVNDPHRLQDPSLDKFYSKYMGKPYPKK